MRLNNSLNINGVNYAAAIDMVFEGVVPQMNGSLISVDNVIACMYTVCVPPILCCAPQGQPHSGTTPAIKYTTG